MQGKAHSPGHWTRCTGQIGTVALEGVCLYVACATFLCACTFNLEYTIDLYV